ncbi:MAG: cysteine synthase A [Paludibacteraceae bacterium]|nr:cysteine synthase A [Paludibacteraceae bacterium]
MMYDSLTELIGNTPLLRLHKIEQAFGLQSALLAKVEAFNPGGSSKDRVALNMIEDAERKGLLKPGATIIEPTSGNTGIGIAWVARVKGYRAILTMPDTMSQERQSVLRAMGAEVVLTAGAEGMTGSIRKAQELNREITGSIILQQFSNPANPAAHHTTAEEIWRDTEGKVDVLVAGVGTGGTLSGTARYLREYRRPLHTIAVEPASSRVLSGGQAAPHGLQGIGANFVPDNYDPKQTDEIVGVTDDEATAATRLLAEREGLLVGISSGAALHAAIEYAKCHKGQNIVVILPDSGERYLSTPLFG